jgi:(p)ppGpp synthase/HD superfamily hydrolase
VKNAWPLTERFKQALEYATVVHGGQVRKGTFVPYISHLLAVCALVLEDGGDEDQAIAALLHDAVEDGGGPPRLADVRRQFGDRVGDIVEACTDTDKTPKPPWKERKTRYIAQIRQASREARWVSCADKVHNLRTILLDYREHGEGLWPRFNASGDDELWYYGELVEAFRQPNCTRLVDELARLVTELKTERERRTERAPRAEAQSRQSRRQHESRHRSRRARTRRPKPAGA